MKVTPYNNAWTFLVSSRSRKGDHMVDLLAYGKNGACACEDFNWTCLKVYKVTREIKDHGDNRTRCDHILAAREYRLNDFLARLELQSIEEQTQKIKKQLQQEVFGRVGHKAAAWLTKGL